MSVLVVTEHLQGTVRDVTRELVTAGRPLGPVAVAVIARDPGPLAAAVDVEGVEEIVTVAAGADEFEGDTYQQALEALIESRRPRVVLLGFTVNAMSYAAAVAAKLGLGYASDVHGVALEGDAVIATRSFYAGKVSAELEFPGAETVLLLLRPTTWPPAEGTGGAAVSSLAVEVAPPRARHVEFTEPAATGDVDITQADVLLSIGRGIGDADAIAQFEGLAAKMGATLSVSRPIVDAGWMPASRQVGQSGKTVKPKVYLAFGISGAVQHLAGMKASGTIVAVNTDPEASIFGVAHYGAVVDLFDVAEELEKLY
ncbi:MAG: electron transfer flavoprotein subunit alpha/FixB family protein [Thermoleophilia bacterium]|nr:electron transfer flavoprotein subunit alpha/FixB family protein [Thermoleophilia bacterium]MDH5333767.1 electron transfer flavoprotein subunit alpha/FixB family protein [Thermoleophilia bacterium]